LIRSISAVLTLSALASAPLFAAEWNIDNKHSSASFAVSHMAVSMVHGSFNGVKGKVDWDPAHPADAKVDVTIDATSVDTHDEDRDKHLKSPDFFDVAKYPAITFVSTKITPAGGGKLSITGDLTLHGVTKSVVLDVSGPTSPVKDPWGMTRSGASATTHIDRKEFGLVWNKNLDSGGVLVGDDIQISLEVEFVHK
jgi:polyisoprenoid-binding protein YceI